MHIVQAEAVATLLAYRVGCAAAVLIEPRQILKLDCPGATR